MLLKDRVAIVTSGTDRLASARIGAAGLPRPRVVITADDVALGKPDPEAGSWLRRRLWLAAGGALVIATGADSFAQGLSRSMPSSSAAIMAREARRPPMSGVPAISDSVPSSFSVSATEVSPPMLNQKPQAMPRPCASRRMTKAIDAGRRWHRSTGSTAGSG